MILALLLLLAVVPCDPVLAMEVGGFSPTPCLNWDTMEEEIDGFRVYYWHADEDRGDTWVYEPCYWIPNDYELYGDMAGDRICRGEVLSRATQRDIAFSTGVLVNLCVTAMRYGPDERWWESVNCSDIIEVCWPELWEY